MADKPEDELDEGLRAAQEIARREANAANEIAEATEPLADAAGRAARGHFASPPQRNSNADPPTPSEIEGVRRAQETLGAHMTNQAADNKRATPFERGRVLAETDFWRTALGPGGAWPRHHSSWQSEPSPETPQASSEHERANPMPERGTADVGIPAGILIAVGTAGLGGIFAGWPHVGAALSLFGFGGALAIAMRLRLVPQPALSTPHWRAFLLAMAVLTWGFVGWQTWVWFHPSVQGYTQAQLDQKASDKVAAATKPLQDRIAALQRENDALRQQAGQGKTASAPPKPAAQALPSQWSKEDIDIKTSIWESVQNVNLRDLINAFNSLDYTQSHWDEQIGTSGARQQLASVITNQLAAYNRASDDLETLRKSYPNYGDVAAVLDQPGRGSLGSAANALVDALRRIPPDSAVQLRPLAGASRRELVSTQQWLTDLHAATNKALAQLSDMR